MRRHCDERARKSLVLPVLRGRGPASARGAARHLGMPVMHPGVHGHLRRSGGEEMSTAIRYQTDELKELATRAAIKLDREPAEKIVEWAAETFGERFCVTSSFADAVLVHVVSAVVPGVEVIFLDT